MRYCPRALFVFFSLRCTGARKRTAQFLGVQAETQAKVGRAMSNFCLLGYTRDQSQGATRILCYVDVASLMLKC